MKQTIISYPDRVREQARHADTTVIFYSRGCTCLPLLLSQSAPTEHPELRLPGHFSSVKQAMNTNHLTGGHVCYPSHHRQRNLPGNVSVKALPWAMLEDLPHPWLWPRLECILLTCPHNISTSSQCPLNITQGPHIQQVHGGHALYTG